MNHSHDNADDVRPPPDPGQGSGGVSIHRPPRTDPPYDDERQAERDAAVRNLLTALDGLPLPPVVASARDTLAGLMEPGAMTDG